VGLVGDDVGFVFVGGGGGIDAVLNVTTEFTHCVLFVVVLCSLFGSK